MVALNYRFIGRGVYSLPEAERLTAIPRARIRRWARGYTYNYRGERAFSGPVVKSYLAQVVGVPALDFADLIEMRFLDQLRERGVSWTIIRTAARKAREILKKEHPFLTRKFRSDGKRILLEIGRGTEDQVLLDLVTDQYEVGRLIDRFLIYGLEFKGNEVLRWYPLGRRKRVIVDPARSFGAPISPEGVPTRVLAQTCVAEDSIEAVAHWYDVSPASVRHAVEFEHR